MSGFLMSLIRSFIMSKFAVLGHGVVGSGTVELFLKNKDNINSKQGIDLDLKYILDIRDFPGLPYSDKFTKGKCTVK